MFGVILISFLFGVVSVASAPAAGPDFNSIQYANTFNLTYQNHTLDGLGAIDNSPGVDSQMADSLKAAINRALPGYLSSGPSSASSTVSSSTSVTSGPSSTQSSSNGASSTIMSSTPAVRAKRDASTTTQSSSSSTTQNPMSSTTQPYGTDEEFYARTDLIHFQVNIDDLEGSGITGLPI